MDIGNDESNDKENHFFDDSDLDDNLGEFDADKNQLYIWEMILSFHAWTKVDHHMLGTGKGIKNIDMPFAVCSM